MTKQFIKDGLGWGFILWLIGYVLGMVLFFVVPNNILGWVIMPLGTIITLWVLFKKVKSQSLPYYLLLGVVWMVIAVIFDYLFIVLMLQPTTSYYKLDVYVYYGLTFLLPLLAGGIKTGRKNKIVA